MCGRYTLTSGLTILQRRFGFAAEQLSLNPRYNLSPGQNAPVLVGEGVKVLKLIDAHKFEAIAHLIDLLKDTPDPHNAEGSLFDHTMIFHGCGMATGTHSTRNLPLMLAGGGFKHGEHLVLPAEKGKRILASNLLLSILQNFGLEVDRFGNSSGTLRGLEVG